MSTVKTFFAIALALVAMTAVVLGSAMAADQDSTVSPLAFTFHYGPFGPGKKLMGPAPEKGFVFLDIMEGASQKPASLHEVSVKASSTKP